MGAWKPTTPFLWRQTMILAKLTIYNTARRLMILSVESELEDADAGCSLPGNFHTPDSVVDCILDAHIDDVMLTMGIIIGKIEQAWGHSIGLVFHHMGYGEDFDAHTRLLYRLIMGCLGHCIFLDDDGPSGPYATGFDKAGRILCNIVKDTGKRFEAVPVRLDADCPIRELVSEHLIYRKDD